MLNEIRKEKDNNIAPKSDCFGLMFNGFSLFIC